MKKRILSLLLLLAMLVTMIPVATVAAEETTQPEESTATDYDYYDLYVQDGLKALFTAIDKDDETVRATNNGNGQWLNRVAGGKDATLGGNFWRRTANGGIGYDSYRGSADDDKGTNYVDEPTVNGVSTNTYSRTSYLGFGNAMLPKDDFTVEYVAEYLPIYTRLTGETAEIGSKVVGEAYTFNEAGMTGTGGLYGAAVDLLGYLGNFAGVRDGKDGERGRVRWLAVTTPNWNNCVTAKDPLNNNNYYSNSVLDWKSGNTIYHKRGGIYAFAIMADENTADGKNEATYTLFHDNVAIRTSTAVMRSFTDINGNPHTSVDYTVDSTGDFRLSHTLPTDFYVVRIYEKALTPAEQAQNHAVDVLEYYNLAIDKEKATAKMDRLSLLLAGVGFEKDAIVKATEAARLQKALEELDVVVSVVEGEYYDLYVQDGLTALFTAIDKDDETVYATNKGDGKWLNRVAGGKNATLGGNFWRTTANGGIGYDLYRGAADDATGKNYVDDPGNNTYNRTTYLGFGNAMLPKDDFTVEYVAEYLPIYTRLTGETADIGSKVVGEAYTFNEAGMTGTGGLYGAGPDILGYLGNFAGVRDGKDGERGMVRWLAVTTPNWNNCVTAKDPLNNNNYYSNSVLSWKSGDEIFHKRGGIYAFAIMADENTADGKNEATYTLFHDNAVLRTSTAVMRSFIDINDNPYTSVDYTVDSTGDFRLSYCLPTDFYVVRIYEKALTPAEQAQNHVVDVLDYYGLVVDKAVAKEKMDRLSLLLANVGFEKDAIVKAAKAVELATAIENMDKAVTGGYEQYYVQNGLIALYSAFVGDTTVDLTKGTWANKVAISTYGAATIRNTAMWTKKSMGLNDSMNLETWTAQAAKTGISLPESMEDLASFTVEAFAVAEGVTENGARLVDYWGSGANYGRSIEKTASFRFGLLMGGFNNSYHVASDGQSIATYWMLWNKGYQQNTGLCTEAEGVRLGSDGRADAPDNGWRVIANGKYSSSEMPLYPTIMHVTKGTAESGDVSYGIYYNGSATANLSTTVTKASYDTFLTVSTNEAHGAGRFSLFNTVPATVYAIRVYDRVLSNEEMLQNRAVDIAAFYELKLSDSAMADAEQRAELFAMLNNAVAIFDVDYTAKMAKKAELQALLNSNTDVVGGYVISGLVNSFSTFGDNADTVDLAAGTWTDTRSGAVATLGTPAAWHQTANGAVGFNIYRGQADADGSNYVDSVSTNNYSNSNIQLKLGIGLLPKGDYTVEYTAEYKPMYTLLTGSTTEVVGTALDFKVANGITWEGQYWGPLYMNAIDKLGFLSNWTDCRYDNFDGKGYGATRWVAHASVGYSNCMGSGIGMDGIFQKQGGVYTYAIVRDKTEGVNEATFALYHDATVFKQSTVTNSAKVDFTVEDTGDFYLSRALSTEFYTLRIYNRALTDAELLKNMVADRIAYYGITLSDEVVNGNAAMVSAVYGAISNFGFETDVAKKAAKKAEIESAIADAIFAMSMDDLDKTLYVQDGLTAIFTAFRGQSKYTTGGKWMDRISGNALATLKGNTWAFGERGGIGFNLYRGQADDASGTNYVDSVATNNYYNASNPTRLELDISLLPQGDFTVDYAAEYKPVYTLLTGTTAGNITEDKIVGEAWDYHVAGLVKWGQQYYYGHAVESYGYLNGFAYCRDSGEGTGRSGLRWHVNKAWNGTTRGGDGGMTTEFSTEGADFRPRGAVHNYSITRDVTVDDVKNEATYSIIQDAEQVKSYTQNDTTKADFSVADPGHFFLSDDLPTDFYALRIYNRVLTDAELAMNRLADFVSYYRITLSDELIADADKMAMLASTSLSLPMVKDEVAGAGTVLAFRELVASLDADDRIYDMYVQDGLVANYTALSAQDKSASVETGSWTNRVVGREAATFAQNQLWKRNLNGSVGVVMYRGMIDENGNYVDDSSYNTYKTATRLNLGIAMLPKDDFTIEYVAEYTGTKTVDTKGNVVGDTFDLYPDMPTQGHQNRPDQGGFGPQDYIGYMASYSGIRDGKFGSAKDSRGRIRWLIYKAPGDWQNCRQTYYAMGEDLATGTATTFDPVYMDVPQGGEVFYKRGAVHTFTISRDENTEGEKNEATYTLLRDYVQFSTATVAKFNYQQKQKIDGVDTLVETYNIDFTVDDTGNFYLADRMSIDFYALRIYDRTLTVTEQLTNHFADIVIYYELTLPENFYTDNNVQELCISALANAEIVTDGVKKVARAKEYQAKLDDLSAGASADAYDYDSMYVQQGLVALYTAFEGDNSISPFSGTWANKVEGSAYGAATIRNPMAWERKSVGYGYTMTLDDYYASAAVTGINLPDSLENLDAFTVEAFARVDGITNEDGTRYVNRWDAVRDENGNLVQDTNEDGSLKFSDNGSPIWKYEGGSQYGYYVNNTANFRFGLLTNLFFASLYPQSPATSISGRWYLYNKGYPGTNPAANEHIVLAKLVKADDPATEDVDESEYTHADSGWRLFGPDKTPTAGVMHVTKTTTASNVSYAISYGCSAEVTQSTTVTVNEYNRLLDIPANEGHGAGRFSLFNAMPTTVYAIRVYNRELSIEEKQQNNFIDKAAFYGLNLDDYKAASDDIKAKIHAGFVGVDTFLTKEEVESMYNFFVNSDIAGLTEELISFSEYLPITAGAFGYRALFAISAETVALLEKNGYEVFYGAIVAPGGKFNTMDGLTVSFEGNKLVASAGTLVEVAGTGLTPTFYNYVGGGKDAELRFSAAVTANDPSHFGVDVLVRGYTVVKAPDGTLAISYDADTQYEGSLSVLAAADYFVNNYTGPVDTMYKYMNSAVLRQILTAFGIACRDSLDNDIILYVDAENGSDENSGLLATEAYATIAKAFDAAKAHLAKAGRKGVTIQLAEGTYTITEALSLTAEDIRADGYYLNVIGSGETTVLTSVTEIARDDELLYDDDGAAMIQLPGTVIDGVTVYPEFRALYGDGELLQIAHKGGDEDTYSILGMHMVDADGNVIPQAPRADGVSAQFTVAPEDTGRIAQAVYHLPYELFEMGMPEDYYIDTELHILTAWVNYIFPIDHIVYADDYVEAYVDYDQSFNAETIRVASHPIIGDDCFLENSRGLLYENGDTYYYDSETGVLYFYPGDLSAEDFTSFGYAAAENAFIFDGVSNISVSNMTITGLDTKYLTKGMGVSLGQSATATLLPGNGEEKIEIGSMTSAAILGQNTTGVSVTNVTVRDTLGAGVVMKGVTKDLYVDSNTFRNLGDAAIRLGYGEYRTSSYTNGAKITNNLIVDVANLYNSASAVTIFSGANMLVAGNTVRYVPYSAFSFGWKWGNTTFDTDKIKDGYFNLYNVEFAYNYVADYLMSQRDGGAIYTLGGYTVENIGDAPVNFMHHNYVNVTYDTGLLGNSRWSVMGYYHDNTSSHWYDYENVLVNTSGAGLTALYLQAFEGGEAHNNTLENNYMIGFDSASAVYGKKYEISLSEQFANTCGDYIYADIAALENHETIGSVSVGASVSKESSATAANDVAAIFATAGALHGRDYMDDGELGWTAEAFERQYVLDKSVAVSGDLPVYRLTFTDGKTTVNTYALEGAKLTVPTAFISDTAVVTFRVGGEVIDPATYVVPAYDVTVNVTMEIPKHNVTFDTGLNTVTVAVEEGAKVTLPAELVREGYRAICSMAGAPFDLDSFVMGKEDLSINVMYEKLSFTVTYVNADGLTESVTLEYGARVPAPSSAFNKTGYSNVYTLDGNTVSLAGLTVPAKNVTLTVSYSANRYQVQFLYPENKGVFATTLTPFDGAIVLPDIAVGGYVDALEDDDYRYKFVGWEDYTEGDTLTEAGHNVKSYVMIVEPEAKAPQYMLGDIDGNGVVEGIDITLVTQIASGILDISSVVGDPDLDGNGVVEGIDITLVTQIASGILS